MSDTYQRFFPTGFTMVEIINSAGGEIKEKELAEGGRFRTPGDIS